MRPDLREERRMVEDEGKEKAHAIGEMFEGEMEIGRKVGRMKGQE